MRNTVVALALILAASFAPPTAAQTESPAEQFFDRVEEVDTVAWPLLVAGADLCQLDAAYRTGVRHTYVDDERVGEVGARIAAIAGGSPADLAGLKRGDVIKTINGDKVESWIPGRGADRLQKLMDNQAGSSDPVTFGLVRDGVELELAVVPVKVCDLKVQYLPMDSMLTPRSGATVIVSDMMFSVADQQWQRQAFLAPDIAHAMNPTHSRNNVIKKFASVGGNFLSAVTGIGAIANASHIGTSFGLNKGESLKADRVSLFLLARVGVDVDLVPEFWRSVYAYPKSEKWDQTYFGLRPTIEERSANFEEVIAEIKAIRARDEALDPFAS